MGFPRIRLLRSQLSTLWSPYLFGGLGAAVGISFALGRYWVTIFMGAVLCTCAFYHNLIWLYSQCDELIGGLPKASKAYVVGFLTLMAGYILLSSGFLVGEVAIEYVGGISLTIGLTCTVFATKTLFDRIMQGASLG